MLEVRAPGTRRVANVRERQIGMIRQMFLVAAREFFRAPDAVLAESVEQIGRPDRESSFLAPASARFSCGASSMTTCAFVPENPNELTPAMRRLISRRATAMTPWKHGPADPSKECKDWAL